MFLKQSILSDAATKEGLKIVYDDLAPYAKENSTPQVIDTGLRPRIALRPRKGLYPRKTKIRNEFPDLKRDDLKYPGYALCLPRFALLDGDYINFPNVPEDYGYISDEVSNGVGDFSYTDNKYGLRPHKGLQPSFSLYPSLTTSRRVEYPELTVTFNQKFTSVGILLTFNDMSGDYANRLNIKWFANGNLLSGMDFNPDNSKYFCNNYVKFYDKLVITFYSTSKPYRPVFLTRIDYGIYRDFFDDEIKEISCQQEINAISESISINTLNFTVRTKSAVPFDLQKKQKLALYFDGKLLGNFYLKNGAKKSEVDYYMDTHDALGILDGNEFAGGIYTGQTMRTVINEIFEGEDFKYLLDTSFDRVQLYGYIPYTSKRNALVQIAFACGAVVDTSNYDGVIIYPKQEVQTGKFTDSETFDGITLDHTDVVTGVRLSSHSYHPTEDVEELYKDVLNGTVEVIFSEAHHSLSITGGTIKTAKNNYAVISGTGSEVILSGKKYSHFTTTSIRENPNILFNKNIKEVQDATLVHSGNVQNVLNRVYEYYQRAENVAGTVLMNDKVLGQIVGIDTGYDGVKTGTIERINYDFTREIAAEVVIHE